MAMHAASHTPIGSGYTLLQVPLGVQLHDETRLDEMCAIMDELHRYVPQVAVTRSALTSDGVVQ